MDNKNQLFHQLNIILKNFYLLILQLFKPKIRLRQLIPHQQVLIPIKGIIKQCFKKEDPILYRKTQLSLNHAL